MSQLEEIIAVGRAKPRPEIVCQDGFTMSVQSSWAHYCSPRPEYTERAYDAEEPGPFFTLEVGFPSERPEPWAEWKEWCDSTTETTDTVYGYVPVEAVRALVALHGGERVAS